MNSNRIPSISARSATDRIYHEPGLSSIRERTKIQRKTAKIRFALPEPPQPSNRARASARCFRIGSFCGHFDSQRPHPTQAEALRSSLSGAEPILA